MASNGEEDWRKKVIRVRCERTRLGTRCEEEAIVVAEAD